MGRCACMNVFALSRRAGRRYNRADPVLAREFQHRQLRGCGRPRRPQARSWQTVMVRGDRRQRAKVVSEDASTASRMVGLHARRGAVAVSCTVHKHVKQSCTREVAHHSRAENQSEKSSGGFGMKQSSSPPMLISALRRSSASMLRTERSGLRSEVRTRAIYPADSSLRSVRRV